MPWSFFSNSGWMFCLQFFFLSMCIMTFLKGLLHTGQEVGNSTVASLSSFFSTSIRLSFVSSCNDSSIFESKESFKESDDLSSIETSESEGMSSWINSASFKISVASSSIEASEWSKFFVSSWSSSLWSSSSRSMTPFEASGSISEIVPTGMSAWKWHPFRKPR